MANQPGDPQPRCGRLQGSRCPAGRVFHPLVTPGLRARAAIDRWLVLAALVLGGCAPYRSLEIPNRAAHTLPNRQEKLGLTAALQLFLSPESVDRHFGPDLWEAGYFPVAVCFENRGAESVEIRREEFQIWLESGRDISDADQLRPRPLSEVAGACRRSTAAAYLWLPLLVFPAIWAHREIADYNYDLASDLQAKALPPYYRLEPGDPPLQGCLFFTRPEGVEDLAEYLKSAELWLDAKVEGSRFAWEGNEERDSETGEDKVGETITFILSLNGGKQ
ncbi:MAG: hypothetical protein JXA90_16190 [Planctomycetes bacterium]|nr:hypothetical protein [Planctomycetota bacterium]